MKIRIKLCILMISFLCAFNLNAQHDSIKVQDTSKVSPKFTMTKSPTGAIYRSLILPGWGQYYVESYWKIPLFSGGILVSTYFAIDYHLKYKEKIKEIDDFLALDPANLDSYKHNILKNQREHYRDNRDQAIFFIAGFYAAAAIDAYVGAHLFDFNVDDNISLNISPRSYNAVSLNLEWKFK